MPHLNRTIKVVRTAFIDEQSKESLILPNGWELLPPGDAGLTRRVKKAGLYWLVQEKKGRRVFSKGVYAPSTTISVEKERATPAHAKKTEAARRRREKKQVEYVDTFYNEVLTYLNFHETYLDVAKKLARKVTEHATPVGSGTVARTSRIPTSERASAAVIAWLRHQTTSYDNMRIARVKGRRREVRRELAKRSEELLKTYRLGEQTSSTCPLQSALDA